MELIFIVNVSQQSFFRYYKKNEIDTKYTKILSELLSPPDKKTKYSHWSKEDKIVFCPTHLQEYINRIYNELYLHNSEIIAE